MVPNICSVSSDGLVIIANNLTLEDFLSMRKSCRCLSTVEPALEHLKELCKVGHKDAVRFFGINDRPPSTISACVCSAAMHGRADVLGTISLTPSIANAMDEYLDATALMLASTHGHTACIHALLNANAKINATNSFGSTALIFAARNCQHECVRLLFNNGAKIDIIDATGRDALRQAAYAGDLKSAGFLLDHTDR